MKIVIVHMSVRYNKIGNISKRRLNPLDNFEFTSQYVSGMANESSQRISLNHRG